MNELHIFENKDFGKVRTISDGGKVLFCGSDVAKALGYTNQRDALNRHCRYVVKRDVPHPQAPDKIIEMSFITEGDVYRLVFGSNLPSAERFMDWVADEVLPTIRKTGGYVNNDDLFVNTYLPNADDTTKALFRSTLETIRTQNAKLEEYKPKAIFADAVSASKTSILVGELAKILHQNGVTIGQNRLFEWLRNNGYLCCYGERYNMPTQRSMEMSLFEIKETTINNPDGSIRVSRTVKVTGKGQQYFINKFLGWSAEA